MKLGNIILAIFFLIATPLTAQTFNADSLAAIFFRQLNNWRIEQSLLPVVYNQTISKQTKIWAEAMIIDNISKDYESNKRLVHANYDGRKKMLGQLIFGDTLLTQDGEVCIIILNFNQTKNLEDRAAKILKDFIDSPGHKKQISKNYQNAQCGITVITKNNNLIIYAVFLEKTETTKKDC